MKLINETSIFSIKTLIAIIILIDCIYIAQYFQGTQSPLQSVCVCARVCVRVCVCSGGYLLIIAATEPRWLHWIPPTP